MERIEFYKSKIELYTKRAKIFKSKILRFSLLRLGVFLLSVAGVYFLWSSTLAVVGVVVGFLILFVFLVKKHSKLKNEHSKTKLLIKINEEELHALDGDFSIFHDGNAYKDQEHAYAEDVDLFGEKSFFQYLNRTGLYQGQKRLATWLKSNDNQNIKAKQDAIKELSENVAFRQDFTAEARMLDDQSELSAVLKALKNHKNFIPKSFRIWGMLFNVLSLAVILLYAFNVFGLMQLILWIFIGFGITGIYLKKINALFGIATKGQELFRQYQKLISAVEQQHFSSKILKDKQSQLLKDNEKSSDAIKAFSKYIDAFEQRQNLMLGFVLISLLLWDLRQCFKIEKWLSHHYQDLDNWFDIIADFDAQNSLANLTYNQADYVFPVLNDTENYILKCKSATHPLIPKKQAVVNDFEIKNEDFLIITGANMAGKSTFLRTVSLMIVMANLGLPVCAESCHYKPIKLITSMRTSDSLSDESSYFFSELSRLKTIIDRLQNDTYFIVLDEILKGTNSHDKAKGSQQFIEKLVKTKSSGIIATHDLSLCTLSENLDEVHNFYFDAEIINDELHFDYKFKKGICQNMNASFLLKKMGIV